MGERKHDVLKRALILWCLLCAAGQGAEYAIAVSVDGLGSTYLQDLVDAGRLPNFKRLLEEGAGTTNARTDYDITVTLPNHTTMVTSRPVNGPRGHGWTSNTDPAQGVTIHSQKGAYVAGMFDVAHDHGLRTGMWAAKTKFSLFKVSYDAEHGAPDVTGEDNGRNKLDVFVYGKTCAELTADFVANMRTNPCHLALVHFGEGDAVGHTHGWGSAEYQAALATIDGCLGQIMDLIATNERLRGRTVLLVTSDHGGVEKNHGDAQLPLDYTIPFYVWGAGIAKADLYALNRGARASPGGGRPPYEAVAQPVRNGEVGNVALSELGLGPIPGSLLNARQDLRLRAAVRKHRK